MRGGLQAMGPGRGSVVSRPTKDPIRWRTFLPVEHGSWVFLLVPALAGLLLAPGAGGAGLVLLSLAVFLARTPLQRLVRQPQTAGLVPVLMGLSGLAMAGLVLALQGSGWKPLGVLALGGVALLPALAGAARKRALVPELLAALGAATLLPAVLGAGGWPVRGAALATLVYLLMTLPPFLFVRRQVAWARKLAVPAWETAVLHGLHLLACAVGAMAWQRGWAGVVIPVWMVLLWGRTLVVRTTLPARQVGWLEAGAALAHLVVLVLGLRPL